MPGATRTSICGGPSSSTAAGWPPGPTSRGPAAGGGGGSVRPTRAPRLLPGRGLAGNALGPGRALAVARRHRVVPSAGRLRLVVVASPDQAVQGDEPGDGAQSRYERDEQEQHGGQARQVDRYEVHVGGGREARDVVPELVEPQPRLAGVAAGLVHDPPLVTEEVLGPGPVRVVAAVLQEEQGLGEVGPVEAVAGDEGG